MNIITGMHRSGTSLAARLFFEAGADMGKRETFHPPDKWNPDGYYEQPDIHAINMPLINGPWWKFAYFFLPSEKTIRNRGNKRKDLISQTSIKYDGKVVKEARFCLTLPAWLDNGNRVNKVLICIRTPSQVAKSIQKRNFITMNHAYYLWAVHNERILKYTANIPTWILNYNNVLEEDSFLEEIEGSLNFFDIHLPTQQLLELRKKFVKKEMNHHQETHQNFPEKVKNLWEELNRRHENQYKGR